MQAQRRVKTGCCLPPAIQNGFSSSLRRAWHILCSLGRELSLLVDSWMFCELKGLVVIMGKVHRAEGGAEVPRIRGVGKPVTLSQKSR